MSGGGVFGPLLEIVPALGRAIGSVIGTVIGGAIAATQGDPELPTPPDRQSQGADFASVEELKRRGIIDER